MIASAASYQAGTVELLFLVFGVIAMVSMAVSWWMNRREGE